jgi:diguanylate cyclase (GGDEF)-like protein
LVRALEFGTLAASPVLAEVRARPWTFAYVALSTLLAFSLFGYLLGRQADRLYELSHSDALTGLRNRRAFEERMADEIVRSARYGSPLSVLLLDVDGLKEHNDRRGHRAGDAALVRVADAIRSGSRKADVAARWGGDEFVILAPSTGGDEALQLAERVRASAADPENGISISGGLATWSEVGRGDGESLLRAADAALYEAKRRGRNRVVAAPASHRTGVPPPYTPRP